MERSKVGQKEERQGSWREETLDRKRKGKVHGKKKSWIERGKLGFMERSKVGQKEERQGPQREEKLGQNYYLFVNN